MNQPVNQLADKPANRPLSLQTVLITGASSGIGAALAILLATKYPGMRLVLAARSLDKLAAVAETCRQAKAEVCILATDMAQSEQVKALAQKTLDQFGRIDVLVNNAGYGQMGPIELIPTDLVRQQFEVNLLGVITLIQAVIPIMRHQGGGRIINVSSIGGRLAFPLGGLYSSSKFALEGLSDALRMELEPFNIQVSLIEPGPVTTDFFDTASQRMQQAVPDPAETVYGPALTQLDALNQRLVRMAWSSNQVANVMLKALSDRKPRPRYVAATGGSIMLWLMTKLLPTRAVDLFWQRFYGIDRLSQ